MSDTQRLENLAAKAALVGVLLGSVGMTVYAIGACAGWPAIALGGGIASGIGGVLLFGATLVSQWIEGRGRRAIEIARHEVGPGGRVVVSAPSGREYSDEYQIIARGDLRNSSYEKGHIERWPAAVNEGLSKVSAYLWGPNHGVAGPTDTSFPSRETP